MCQAMCACTIRSWCGAGGVCAGDGLHCWLAAAVHERGEHVLDAGGAAEGGSARSPGAPLPGRPAPVAAVPLPV